jgi:hypothetical protein
MVQINRLESEPGIVKMGVVQGGVFYRHILIFSLMTCSVLN